MGDTYAHLIFSRRQIFFDTKTPVNNYSRSIYTLGRVHDDVMGGGNKLLGKKRIGLFIRYLYTYYNNIIYYLHVVVVAYVFDTKQSG